MDVLIIIITLAHIYIVEEQRKRIKDNHRKESEYMITRERIYVNNRRKSEYMITRERIYVNNRRKSDRGYDRDGDYISPLTVYLKSFVEFSLE